MDHARCAVDGRSSDHRSGPHHLVLALRRPSLAAIGAHGLHRGRMARSYIQLAVPPSERSLRPSHSCVRRYAGRVRRHRLRRSDPIHPRRRAALPFRCGNDGVNAKRARKDVIEPLEIRLDPATTEHACPAAKIDCSPRRRCASQPRPRRPGPSDAGRLDAIGPGFSRNSGYQP